MAKRKRTGKNARKKAMRKIGKLMADYLRGPSLMSQIFQVHEIKADQVLVDVVEGREPPRVFVGADFSRGDEDDQ